MHSRVKQSRPSYFITIIPGSDSDSPSHYNPENVAVPTGTTVVWVNQDQGAAAHSDKRHAWQQHGLI